MNDIFEDNFLNEISAKVPEDMELSIEHRASCHRCGNIRKSVVKCIACPHVFCKKCADKMVSMDGSKAFADGCPLCKDLCCCGSRKSPECNRQFHCYKKCLRSRLSPTSRNSSPRVMSSNLRRTSSYLSQHSTIDEYMPKSSDSDDELLSEQRTPLQQFVVNGQLSNFPSMDALNTMSLQDPTPMCSEFYEGHPATRTSPFLLTPIDTSAGIDILQNVYEQSAKNKAARNAHGETPTKKMRTTPQHAQQPFSPRDVLESGDSQRDIEVQFRQACYATQPPFNSGIPSIFAPHSLTRETNPFFLQSSLPSAAVLPSIQTLLQSERANPFLTSIPPSLKSELDSVHIPNESALAQQGGFLSHLAVPDAAVGYGFVFGGNSYVSPPPLPTISGKPAASTGTSNNGSSSSSGRVTRQSKAEKGSVAQLPAPQLSVDVSAASPVTPYGRAALANQGFVSTPNIDRACEYLSKQTRTSRSSGGTPFAAGGSNGTNKGGRRVVAVTAEKASPSVTRSQLSELFCTPLAQEMMPFGQSSQRSAESSNDTTYEWTGSSIGSLHNLGVEVLTPAALPQCTPMTVENPQLPVAPIAAQYPPYWQHQYSNQLTGHHGDGQNLHFHHNQQYIQPLNKHNLSHPHLLPHQAQAQAQKHMTYSPFSDHNSHPAAASTFAASAESDRDRENQYLNSFLNDGLSELAQDDIFALCRDVDSFHSNAAFDSNTNPGATSSSSSGSGAMDYSHYHSSICTPHHSSGNSFQLSGGGYGTQLSNGYISTPSTEQASQKLNEVPILSDQVVSSVFQSQQQQQQQQRQLDLQAQQDKQAQQALLAVRGDPYEAYLCNCDGIEGAGTKESYEVHEQTQVQSAQTQTHGHFDMMPVVDDQGTF